jgi:hypothetical protein
MDLSSGQQRLLFGVIVVALAGLGIYLVGGREGAASNTSSPPATTTAQPTTSGVPLATVPSTTGPAVTSPPAGSAPDIYQWLPFSQQDLTAAASTTTAFATAYITSSSYTETKDAYAAKLATLATTTEAATLLNGWSAPGIASTRTADKQVTTGSGTITSIRSFGAGSITFLVTIAEQLTSTTGTNNSTGTYAITVIQNGGGWQVNDVELSGLGNQ